ncbi:MAG TPA: CorA family divalent cation transporter [Ardenticatenaceae bacterium]|nr:CorA family divalent cation transporter [Ardenticatenaceae bacterium]
MPVRAHLYDADAPDREVRLEELPVAKLGERQLLWVDVVGADDGEFKRVTSALELAQNRFVPAGSRSRPCQLDLLADSVRIRVLGVQGGNGRYAPAVLDLFVGHNFVVTAHREPRDYLESFRHHFRGDSRIGQLDAPSFLVALLDSHLTAYYEVLEELEEEVDRLDERALGQELEEDFLMELVALRQRFAQVRRMLVPHREVFAALARPEFEILSGHDTAGHFRALNDRLERVIDAFEHGRELVVGLFEVFAIQTTQRTNDLMRVLAFVTVVIGLAAVIAGAFGMNFTIGFFETGYAGFWFATGLMVLLVVGGFIVARRLHWL